MLDGRLRAKVERALQPVGRGLQRAGVTPDFLTVLGLLCAALTAWLIATGHLGWAVLGVIASGLTDILDGAVARTSGRASPRGAFFDSVCDRVSDALMLGGVAWYLADQSPYLPILALAVAATSMLVSYERAKAEALGFAARGGLMERAERMVLLGIGLAFSVLVPVLWIMLVLTSITAVHRFVKVWRQATPAGNGPGPIRTRSVRFTEWWGSRPASERPRRERRRRAPRP